MVYLDFHLHRGNIPTFVPIPAQLVMIEKHFVHLDLQIDVGLCALAARGEAGGITCWLQQAGS